MKKAKELTKPKISCILTTYNRAEKFLPQAIKSVLDQTFKDFELIIVDDASIDDTQKVLNAFKKADSRIKVIAHQKNFGSDTRGKNEGLLASRGDYIAYIDDDCEWHPYHLEKLLAKLEQNPELDLVYCDMWIYDTSRPEWEGMLGIAMNFDGQFLLNRCFIDTSEVLHKREIAFRVGGWDESLPKFVDWNLWVRMMKAGAKMMRLPIIASNYYLSLSQKSKRIKSESWYDEELGMTMFKPSFNPPGCYIYLPYLGNNREDEKNPKVACLTLTYDRLEYTKRMWESLNKSTKYPFKWFVWDNGSKDGTQEWLKKEIVPISPAVTLYGENQGITKASNEAIEEILKGEDFEIIIKVDNDCEFLTFGWLETIIDLWKRNHLLYITPYPEGLVDNPGGAPRIGYSYIGPYFVEVSYHLSGLCAAVWSKAYEKFRWTDQFLHGNQDREASIAFSKQGFMPMYLPLHRIQHMDTTAGQYKKFPEYFEKRIEEKRTIAR
jgi:glycosyltransferase involved in cell wall biosynthesis